MNALQELLRNRPAGTVDGDARAEAERALAEAWDELDGSGDGGMEPHKLHRRTFNMTWDPPVLKFEIERHGAIVAGGSGYAEIQAWEVDVEGGTCQLEPFTRKRRVSPMSPRWDAEAAAVELTQLILGGAEDERLRWNHGRVQVRLAAVLPLGPKQTTEGRRKRLNESLAIHLGGQGWERASDGWWERKEAGKG